MPIHNNYNRLMSYEKGFVDYQFKRIFDAAKLAGIQLHGDNSAEIAVEALATLIVTSRKLKESDLDLWVAAEIKYRYPEISTECLSLTLTSMDCLQRNAKKFCEPCTVFAKLEKEFWALLKKQEGN